MHSLRTWYLLALLFPVESWAAADNEISILRSGRAEEEYKVALMGDARAVRPMGHTTPRRGASKWSGERGALLCTQREHRGRESE